MKFSILTLSVILILSTVARADIETAKGQCADLGFTPGTEKYADCVMKLLPKEDSKKKISNTDEVINKKDKKVEENVANSIEFNEAIYVGEVKKGKAHGVGVFTFSDGSIYEGKVSKNRIRGEGKYTDSQGNVYEGKFKNGILRIKIEKNIREIIKLNLKTGIQIYAEIKGEGVVSNQWFIAEKNSSGTYELTAKGKRDMENAINSANSGGDGGGEGGGGGCG
jgi:methionine salvage enolase-phosphatase E1